MTIQDIMNAIRDMKGEFQNGNINSEELMECMEDYGFYDTPDFTQLVVE